jgi:aspartyl-tRNA(Asn)/glutamyl-tRNA(Gln) amidotransferase subunit C
MSLSREDVLQVARLARLELSADELTRMADQLNSILGYVEQIQKLNTEGVEPLAHPLPVQNVFRNDEPAPSLPIDETLSNAPNRVGDYFGVPAVFDTE